MPTSSATRAVAALGLVLGIATAALLVSQWRVAPGSGLTRTSVTMIANNTGELAMTPTGAFLRDADISRGPARGRFVSANETGSPLWVRLRVLASSPDLGSRLVVTAKAGGALVYHGKLSGFVPWTQQRFRIRPGGRAQVELTVAVAPGAQRAIQGRVEQLTVEFGARPASR